jgi:HEAT repeat protein
MNRQTVLWKIAVLVALFHLSVGCGQNKEQRSMADLVNALKANDEAARIVAAELLGEQGQMQPDQAVPALAEALKDSSANVRVTAVKALAQIGPEARSAVPALKKALTDSDQGVRLASENALKAIQGN